MADLREQTGVKAGVSKAVPGVVDRVLSVTGNVEAISKVGSHQLERPKKVDGLRFRKNPQAYTLIATNVLEASAVDDNNQVPSANIAASLHTTVRLLVSHALMGSVIGKSGSKIKQIQDASGARMIANKETLPQSTERIVEVSGTPIAIGTAVKEISACLLADQDRITGTVYYHPSAIMQDGGLPGQHIGGFGGISVLGQGPLVGYQPQLSPRGEGRRPPQSQMPSTRGSFPNGAIRTDRRSYSNSYNQNNGAAQAPERSRLIAGLEPDDPNLRTQNISFPADMIGCIIVRLLQISLITSSQNAGPRRCQDLGDS